MDIQNAMENHRLYYLTGATKSLEYRLSKLHLLYDAIVKYEDEIMEALKSDLNKAPFEAYGTEVGFILQEIGFAIKNLRKWMRPKKVQTPLMHFPASSRIYPEPYGVTLIMSPWNYPFQLAIGPLIGAIAAGNCAVVKPSEYSFHTAEIIEKLLNEVFEEKYVSVVRGGRDANSSLLTEKFDYIFFTGSVHVGRVVMEAAAKHVTPVTLELGGKSPCIVDETANIDLAAKRIVWGKFLNAGQTCVAPDYLLVHQKVKLPLIDGIKKHIIAFYGLKPETNDEYPGIINQKHYERLLHLLENEEIAAGGQRNDATRKLAPTVLTNVTWSSPVMQEEIFGPILPLLEFESFDDIMALINTRPKPLAFYLFTKNREREMQAMQNVSFGGGCINDTVIHLGSPYLRFGGVGESGMGQYHGKGSFDTFTHYKSVLKKSNHMDIPVRYPPYKGRLNLLKKIMK